MNRVMGLCSVVLVMGLGGCGSGGVAKMLESEGIATPAGTEEAAKAPPRSAKGFPKDDDAPTEVPNIDGPWTSNWGDPLRFSQNGETATATFDMGGKMDCTWNGKSRFNCSWSNNQGGKGLAQVWWDTDRPVGQWANSKNLNDWGTLKFSPWRDGPAVLGPVTTTGGAAGTCNTTNECSSTPDQACINGACASSIGMKCAAQSDCGPVRRNVECKRNVCSTK